MTLEKTTIEAMEETTIARRKLIRLATTAIKTKFKAKQKTDKKNKFETQP